MVADSKSPEAWLLNAVSDPSVSWSVGTFGALAEFSVSPDEAVTATTDGPTATLQSPRGALRFTCRDGARLIAYEGISKIPPCWSQGLSLCLPVDRAKLTGFDVLAELGADEEAIRDEDRHGRLIDLGIGSAHIDACVRITDNALYDAIRPYFGKPLFTEGHAAAETLYRASPHRVFRSALARIEVYGPIPEADGATPGGPHTHLLPDLLAHQRPFAANVPIPDGWLPVLNAYPPNALRDGSGDPRSFDVRALDRWLTVMESFGIDQYQTLKQQVFQALDVGDAPDAVKVPDDRFARIAARVALRQHAARHGESAILSAWRQALEPNPGDTDPAIP